MSEDHMWSPAHGAVEFEDLRELSRLLETGADPDERTAEGMTLLHHAVDVEIHGAVQSGASPFLHWHGALALDDAVERGHDKAADLLADTMRSSLTGSVISKALAASLDNDIFPDWEFSTLMAVDQNVVQQTLDSWPLPAPIKSDWAASARDERDVVVNNVLNMLLGYPHGLDGEAFAERLGCSQRDVATALLIWRDEEDEVEGFISRMR